MTSRLLCARSSASSSAVRSIMTISKVSEAARQSTKTFKRNASSGPHYNEPTGFLFGEKPPPPGEKRKKEDWENIWYYGFFGTMALGAIGYIYQPREDIGQWAEREAIKRLDARGEWRYKPSPYADPPKSLEQKE